MLQTIAITVTGIVQGVYYRQSTKARALENGIGGEVKNEPDGSVSIIATGNESQLKNFISWCEKGPETAVVAKVIVKEIPLRSFSTFKIVK